MSSILLITNLVLLVAIAIFIFFNQSEATGLGLNMNKKTNNNFFIQKKGDSLFYRVIFGLAAAIAVIILLSGRMLNKEYGNEKFLEKIETIEQTKQNDTGEKQSSPADLIEQLK